MSQCTRNGVPFGRPYTHHRTKQLFRRLVESGLTHEEHLRIQKKESNDRYQAKLEQQESSCQD